MYNHQYQQLKQLLGNLFLPFITLLLLLLLVDPSNSFSFLKTSIPTSLSSPYHNHDNNHRIIKPSTRQSKKSITTLFQSDLTYEKEEEKRRIKDVLNNILVENQIMTTIQTDDSDITGSNNQNIKEINLELVSIGKEFDSYKTRFDYYSLWKKHHQQKYNNNNDHDDDNANPNNHNVHPSIWIRDNQLNVNVKSFLESSRNLSSKEAEMEEQNLHLQSYHRQFNNQQGLGNKSNTYNVTTLYGLSTSILDEYGVQQYEKKISWQGDKYTTELYNKNNDKLFIKVVKYLSFGYSDNDEDLDHTNGNSIVLVVNSTLYNESEKSISCLEKFRPAYSMKDQILESFVNDPYQLQSLLQKQQGRYMRSEMKRVPGCTSIVNVCTTLVPIVNNDDTDPSFQVIVDGESDTLVSRGLLAVLSSTLSLFNSNDILNIDPFTFADDIQLRSVLTAGRNDGLSNMVSVVQNQIRQLLVDYGVNVDQLSSEMKDLSDDAFQTEIKSQDRRPTVAMLLSGGVDSAVALNILRRQNYNVTAFYLKIWLEDELAHLGQCPWEDDYNVCVEVCKHAGNVPLEAISLQDAYKERVISYTIDEAKRGFTPNPDIMCNSRIKFGCFYDAIADRGFDYVASGHYAQLMKVNGDDDDGKVMKLLRAPDPIKDQSYFLAALRQDQLKRVLFPIGHLQKSEVRALAEEFDLPNKSRPDSQGKLIFN